MYGAAPVIQSLCFTDRETDREEKPRTFPGLHGIPLPGAAPDTEHGRGTVSPSGDARLPRTGDAARLQGNRQGDGGGKHSGKRKYSL